MLLVVLLAPACTQRMAAGEALEGRPVSGIEFEPSGQPLPRAELDRLVPFKPDPYRAASIRDAIQKL
jgi:hypothetical protein